MTHRLGRSILDSVIVMAALACAYAAEPPPTRPSEAQALAEFKARVKEYVALHEKLESTLPRFPKRSTPEQVEKNQRALGDLIKSARRDARPGEFFTPGMQAFVRRILAEVLAGPNGKIVKASIMDENPGVSTLVLNERYPSSVPLSTMPSQVLAPLPKLKGELEYRFIGSRLILVDTEADIILDFTDDVVPR
jgi:hypothetical protein